MDDLDLTGALEFFSPDIPDHLQPEVMERLKEITDEYIRIGTKRVIFEPIRRVDETEAEHAERSNAAVFTPRKRGRPAYEAQMLLALSLQDLLAKYNCAYGVQKNGNESNLVKLARFIHFKAGSPRGDVDWQHQAELASDKVHALRLILGDGFLVEPGQETLARGILNDAFQRASKNRKRPNIKA